MKELVTRVCDSLCVERKEAELIIASLLERPHFSLYFGEPVDDITKKIITMKIAQLKQGIPIEYVTKTIHFMDYTLRIQPGVFIPRVETEYFVELIIKRIHRSPKMILDIGAGCGAISIALAHAFASSLIFATDISEIALSCAYENINKYKLTNRIHLVRTDLFQGLTAGFDLIVSNPPYVPSSRLQFLPKSVKYYEPLQALNGGKGGTMFTKRMIRHSLLVMNDDGYIAIEIDEDAVDDLTNFLKMFTNLSYTFAKDLCGKNRYLFLEKQL